jgi:hypothetical protein
MPMQICRLCDGLGGSALVIGGPCPLCMDARVESVEEGGGVQVPVQTPDGTRLVSWQEILRDTGGEG